MKDNLSKNQHSRTDILSGEVAAVFAFSHCDVKNPSPMLFDGDKCGLLKSINDDKYYIARSVVNWGYLQNNPSYSVDIIRTEPVELVKADHNASIRKQQHGLDLDLIVDGKPTTVYFNHDLYPFDSFETRQAFEHFAIDAFDKNSKFETLTLIADYFADENFVQMAKERVRYNIEELSSANIFAKKMLLRKVNKVIDQYAKQNSMEK